jgi:23S rRNA pseudouridine2605 synthase
MKSGGGRPRKPGAVKLSGAPRDSGPRKEGNDASATPAGEPAEPKGERIAKRLARAGVGSRRDAEAMIVAGRISVNGKTLDSPAFNVNASDRIAIDGEEIPAIERTRLWLYHKPSGLLTTARDPEGRPTIFERLPTDLPRVISVGRLDFNTEGLLLLTNDGGLARHLELPSTGWLRRYRVRAHGAVTQEQLDRLKDGIAVDGVLYGAIDALLEREQGSNAWITVGLREGKNREVRIVLGALGLEVNRLIRVSYGPFQLGDLEPGAVLEIRRRHLRDQLGEKLITEAGCNFDAPVLNEFSNKPVKEDAPEQDRRAPRNRKKPEDRRLEALDKLDTKKRAFGPKRTFTREERPLGRKRPPRDADVRRDRSSNVWMAPGARPGAPGTVSQEGKPKRYGRGTMRPNRGSATRGERRFDEKPRTERRAGERSYVKKDYGDRKPRRGQPFEGKPKDEKRFDDKPRTERRASERPYVKKDYGDRKPRRDRPFGGKPRDEKRFDDKPRGEKRFDDKPRGQRPTGDKPHASKSSGATKRAGRSFRENPGGTKKSREGKKPSGGKRFGGKPDGGKRFDGKPSAPKPGGGPRSRLRGAKRNADRRR